MPAYIETGHAKNVANFEDLISFITAHGATYNPTKATITLTALNALYVQANNDLTNVIVKSVAYNNAVNNRMHVFKPLRSIATRTINALKVSGASDEIIKDAKTVNDKIQGKRSQAIPTPLNPTDPPPNNISVSQQSYDQLIQHFTKLIEILTSKSLYNPNENELKITALNAMLTVLSSSNTVVSDTYTAVANARIARNITLYKPKTGLVPIALDVKDYIKSIFGPTSPQYKQVNKINFKTIKF